MPIKFLPDVALADVAYEATASSLEVLFEECALGLTEVMVNPKTVRAKEKRTLRVSSEDTDRLLYDLLTELIILKDTDSILFKGYKVKLGDDAKSLVCEATGERIDRERHDLRNDAKAVTMHMFGIRREGRTWKAVVVLDI
jgi:SHS2 domain-containing protein